MILNLAVCRPSECAGGAALCYAQMMRRSKLALISEDCLRRVQEATDIVALAESYGLKLKRTGSSFLALCPFHNEKSPSFNINPQMQIFKCFGCGVGGGVFKFVQLMERCEFVEAVELCAQRSGIELVYDGRTSPGQKGQGDDPRKALRWANRIAFDYFRASLADPLEGKVARDYLLSRGFTQETINVWGLGWSPDRWDGLLQYYMHEVESRGGAHKKDKALRVGIEAGIFRHNDEADRTYDAFRGRVMFPILDMQMRPVGFGGRVFEEKPEAGGEVSQHLRDAAVSEAFAALRAEHGGQGNRADQDGVCR